MNDPVTYAAIALGIAFVGIVVCMVVSLVRADRKRKREARRYAAPRRKVFAANFPGDTPDKRLVAALDWAQGEPFPPMIVMEDGVTHFRTVRVYNGVRLTTEGQR